MSIEEIALDFQRKYLQGDPCGQCAILSCQLWQVLVNHNITTKIIYANYGKQGHVFLRTENQFVLDVTCGQFKSAKTSFFYGIPNNTKWYWSKKKCFDSPQELYQYLLKIRWPKEELPYL